MSAENINRWRLVLGKFSRENLSFSGNDRGLNYREMDRALDFLYGREYDEERGVRDMQKGGTGPAQLTVPQWLTKIKTLFPKETTEILERHALDKYNLKELLTDKDVLEKLEPNLDLLKNILQMKHLMSGAVLVSAMKIVKKVADQIREQLEQGIRTAIMGKLDRSSRGNVRSFRNIDFKRTIRKNLKNYDRANRRLMVENVVFHNRVRRYNPYRLVLLVDQSASMLDSVIHSAVMAGIFAALPMLKTHLVVFDSRVVDLTGYIDDAVRTLMSVQLGGGTDIGAALGYAHGLMENPRKTVVVLVTDLCEGADPKIMFRRAAGIIESGAKLIVLTSLDTDVTPVYDRKAAETITALGAEVATVTPQGLAQWIARIIS